MNTGSKFFRLLPVAVLSIFLVVFYSDSQGFSLSGESFVAKHTSIVVAEMYENKKPLSSLVDENNTIIGDVQHLLDFAIIAHPKCMTSSMMLWFHQHEEMRIADYEVRFMKNDQPGELVKMLYNYSDGIKGYKAPRDLHRLNVLSYFRTHWPTTKLIVGIRHPVLWFQSFYNFKRKGGFDLPPAETMAKDTAYFVGRITYHFNLALLGKTPLSSRDELSLLGPEFQKVAGLVPKMENKIFLYDISQPADKNETRKLLFRKDLSDFLGLKKPLDTDPPRENTQEDGLEDSPEDYEEIDICDQKYKKLRAKLMEISIPASKWIREYFMDHPDVTISSPDRFRQVLETWSEDPCNSRI
jgi:hypothetical protein